VTPHTACPLELLKDLRACLARDRARLVKPLGVRAYPPPRVPTVGRGLIWDSVPLPLRAPLDRAQLDVIDERHVAIHTGSAVEAVY
jgi:hypothetical protein